MSLKLNVGLSKKVGLPDYGSFGASCHLEIELPVSLYCNDLDELHQEVQLAFATCRQAIEDQLGRLRSAPESSADGSGNSGAADCAAVAPHNGRDRPQHPSVRRATPAQLRAIRAISDRNRTDLMEILIGRYGVEQPEDLSLAKASQLIDELKSRGACAEERV